MKTITAEDFEGYDLEEDISQEDDLEQQQDEDIDNIDAEQEEAMLVRRK